jgi:ribosomal-protein-alanine N-acetyltransferase
VITLRPLTRSDAGYYRWFNDLDVTDGNSHGVYFMTYEECVDYIEHTSDFVVGIIASTGIHIGNVALQNINNIYRSADLSIIIGEKDYWGKGYGKQACTQMIEHAFNAMNLRRLSLGTFETNDAMKALAVSLGFQWEGLRRKAAWKNGRYVDIVEYGLLREEWYSEHNSDH